MAGPRRRRQTSGRAWDHDPAILYGSPSWVSHNFAKPPIYTKRARRGWDRLLTAFVKRYGPNGWFWRADPGLPYEPIRYWQVWNEPNLPVYFAPRASPARYDRLLRISATALRNADPTARVVIGGLPRTGNRSGQMFSWRFLSGVYKHGGEPDFDVVAIHPFWYGVKGVVHQIKRLRAVTRSHRDGRVPLWIDEVGWTSGHQKKNPFAAGPRGQARLLRRTFKWVNRHRRSMHIDRLFWVLWRDTVRAPYCAFRKAGLVSHHGQPKPAWQAYKSFAQRRG